MDFATHNATDYARVTVVAVRGEAARAAGVPVLGLRAQRRHLGCEIQGGVSVFNDLNINNTRILARKTCIVLYLIHGPLEQPFTQEVL